MKRPTRTIPGVAIIVVRVAIVAAAGTRTNFNTAEAAFSPATALQALFNQAATSDLTLDVNGHEFHGHRAVLVPLCGYLERILEWPQDPKLHESEECSKKVARICLPPIQLPEYLRVDKLDDPSHWFHQFLRVIYGLQVLDRNSLKELCIIAQIADYLICEKMLLECDNALSSLRFYGESALDMVLFCQSYSMPKTLLAAQKSIALNLSKFRFNEKLYALDKVNFQGIMALPPDYREQQFVILYRYVTGQIAGELCSGNAPFKDGEMREMCRDAVTELSAHWDTMTLNYIMKYVAENEQDEQDFIFKVISRRYYRFFGNRY